jgi:hypothetical protein
VIDTFSSLAIGVDENAATATAEVLAAIRDSARSVGASSAIIHHTGKSEESGARGSYTFEGNTDFQFVVKRSGEKLNTNLSCHKIKDGEKPKPLLLKFEPIKVGLQDRRGKEVTSLALASYSSADNSKSEKGTQGDRFSRYIKRAFNDLAGDHVLANKKFTTKDGNRVIAFKRPQIYQQMFTNGDIEFDDKTDKPTTSDNTALKREMLKLKNAGYFHEESGFIYQPYIPSAN